MAKTKRNHRPTSSVTFQQARGAKTVEVPQGLVVYLKESELHYLNPTAATVFLLCATPLTESQVAAVLHEEYALNDPPIEEVRRCLAELVEAKVIVLGDGESHLSSP